MCCSFDWFWFDSAAYENQALNYGNRLCSCTHAAIMTRYCINFYLSQQLIKFAIDIFRILFIAFNSHQFASTSHCIYKSEISNKLWLTHCSKASQCGSQRRFSKHTHGTKKPEKCATLLDCPEANIYLIWPLKRQLLFCTTGWAINKIDKLEILLILFASSSHGGGCWTTLELGTGKPWPAAAGPRWRRRRWW